MLDSRRVCGLFEQGRGFLVVLGGAGGSGGSAGLGNRRQGRSGGGWEQTSAIAPIFCKASVRERGRRMK